MTELLELTLAKHVAGYLADEESVAAAVPEIPVVVVDAGGEKAMPCLVVGGEVREATSGRKVVVVTVALHSRIGTAVGQTTRVVAAGWMQRVEDRLRDDEAWLEWLAGRPLEERTGFRVLHRSMVAAEPVDRTQEGDVVMRLAMGFVCAV